MRNVSLDFRRALAWGRGLRRIEFAIVRATPRGIAQRFVRLVQRLHLRDGIGRTGVHVGVVLLRERAICRTDLRERAAAIQPERGVVMSVRGFQFRNTTARIPHRQPQRAGSLAILAVACELRP